MQTKIGGLHFPARCSMPITISPNNTAYCFGGVFDVEDDEDLCGNFFNDCYCLDLEKLTWRSVTVSGKKENETKLRRKKKECDGINLVYYVHIFFTFKSVTEEDEKMEVDEIEEPIEEMTIADDGVFKITLGPSKSANTPSTHKDSEQNIFQPAERMSCGLAVKRGCLFLYGGMFEDGDKQITYSDMYSLDLKKLDEWKVIIRDDTSKQEWLGSGSEEESEESCESSSSDSETDE